MVTKKYVVRMYDCHEGYWIDIKSELTKSEAEEEMDRLTKGGTEHTNPKRGGYYYRVFPANTRMIFDEPWKE